MMLFAVGVCLNSSMFILQEDKGWEVMNRHVPRAPKYEFSRKKSCLDLGPRWPLLCCLHFASRLSILLCLQTRASTCSLAWGSHTHRVPVSSHEQRHGTILERHPKHLKRGGLLINSSMAESSGIIVIEDRNRRGGPRWAGSHPEIGYVRPTLLLSGDPAKEVIAAAA